MTDSKSAVLVPSGNTPQPAPKRSATSTTRPAKAAPNRPAKRVTKSTKAAKHGKKSKPTPKGRKPTHKQNTERLTAATEGLHAEWSRAIEAHHLRVGGQFQALVSGMRNPRGGVRAKDVDHFRKALSLKIKPGKGRGKDLRNVELMLDELLARLPSAR